jgi:putative transposase
MSSRKIIDLSGENHFVIFSTYQRRKFLSPERTKAIVVEALQTCLENHNGFCQGFVIMPDHVHAILTLDPASSISTFLLAWKKTSSPNQTILRTGI